MAKKTDDTYLVTDFEEIRDAEDREAISSLIKQSHQLFVARGRESTEKSQKSDLWEMMTRELEDLNTDLKIELDGVKLTWKRGGMEPQNVPDAEKIAEVAKDLIDRRAALTKELSDIEFEIQKLEETHTRVELVEVKPKLTVNPMKK
ncbi:hypothetical protein EDF62_1601 [Leucobacter luti]|uniref:Uncharacterized protein n=1 Tax=Leucobacter luti TaxID=340320 RepID=A0A4R6RZP3_9MICO|nr:hypothetical protein [Leucobacter luti]TDP92394.1 hypothetical protein EDF62_1601 [Leucobacter luti]